MTKMLLGLQKYFTSIKPYGTLIIILVGILIVKKFKELIAKAIRISDFSIQTEHNVILISNLMQGIMITVITFFVLQYNGINVNSLISALGIVGIIVGFAVQNLLKDWISGLGLVISRYFVIGDVIKVNGFTGKVIDFNLNVTRIEELYSENIVSISNREISTVEILSNVIFFNVPFPYEMDLKTCHNMIDQMIEKMSQIEGVTLCKFDSTAELEGSCVQQRIRVEIDDKMKLLSTKRKLNDVILAVYEESEWSIPYNHLSIDLTQNTNT